MITILVETKYVMHITVVSNDIVKMAISEGLNGYFHNIFFKSVDDAFTYLWNRYSLEDDVQLIDREALVAEC